MKRPENNAALLAHERNFSWGRLLCWEALLLLLLIGVNAMNMCVSPGYGDFPVLMDALRNFADKAIIAFPVAMVVLTGEIDISVGSTLALSAVTMGLCYRIGLPLGLCVVIAVATGALCGLFNGIILALYRELSSMIVTLSTLIVYRGLASVLMGKESVSFPVQGWFNEISWGDFLGCPYGVLFALAEALLFCYLIHCTVFGRHCRAVGSGSEASRFSGIKVERIKIVLFTLSGLFAGVAAVFLTSWMCSARADMARGYEMDVIAMVVLGGFSTAGGKGTLPGVLLAIPVIGLLRHGLGLMNMGSQAILIVVGSLLVVAAAIPGLRLLFGGTVRRK
ncbi:MAG: ABC transporter permease [Victivallaceae bacterium]|nr:ABC transporter permease [Victivallaceae bacterium]